MSDKRNILCYDVATLPKNVTMRDIERNFREFNIIIWCSSANRNFGKIDSVNPPQIFNKDEIKDFKFIDTAELTEEQIKELKNEGRERL